eukprot:COSAG02_NODE_1508_length_12230_cov_7.647597_5_plen_83_part_00
MWAGGDSGSDIHGGIVVAGGDSGSDFPSGIAEAEVVVEVTVIVEWEGSRGRRYAVVVNDGRVVGVQVVVLYSSDSGRYTIPF